MAESASIMLLLMRSDMAKSREELMEDEARSWSMDWTSSQ